MKKVIERIKNSDVLEPVGTLVFTLLFLTLVVFPFLTEANTISNIIGLVFAIGIGIYNYYFFITYFVDEKEETPIEPGETEIDFIPESELKPKKKRNPKQSFVGIDESKPFVKTRKKSQPKK